MIYATKSALKHRGWRRALVTSLRPLVAGLIDKDRAVFVHVGDGAAVFRLANSDNWKIGSWPASGEYGFDDFLCN